MGRKPGGAMKGGKGGRQDAAGSSGRRKGPAGARGGTVAVRALDGLGEDSDSGDEQQKLDAFQQRRDKVSLRVSDSEEEEDDPLGVMDIEGDEDDEDDEDEDDDDEDLDDDELLEREIQRGGKLGQMARQAKQIAQKLKLQKGEADSDDEEDKEEGGRPAKGKKKGQADDDDDLGWGASKKAYYDDGSEEPEDDDAAREEEEEVIRLQKDHAKRTAAADYGLEEEDESGEEEGEEGEEEDAEDGTLGAAVKKASQAAAAKPNGVAVEAVAKQLGALSSDERTAAVLADAPELASLIEELTAALHEVRHRVGPLVAEVRSGKLATREGLSYLEAKHLLLLQYALHIVFYLLLKAEGKPVKDHPVIPRLVEIRAYLEKIRPIDKQLAYQVDKLLRAAAAAHATDVRAGAAVPGKRAPAVAEDEDEDELTAAPRPDRLVAQGRGQQAAARPGRGGEEVEEEEEEEEEGAGRLGGGAGVYRPPRLNPVSMEMDEKRTSMSRDERRAMSDARRRAVHSETLADLAAEVADAPEERRTALPGFDSMGALRQRHRLAARAEEEEDAFVRVPLSREQAKSLRASRRAGFSTAAVMGDFADDVAGLVAASGADAGPGAGAGLSDLFGKQRVSQRFGGERTAAPAHGGDEDLPRRAGLGDRRAAFDAVAARRAAATGQDDGDGDGEYDAEPKKRGGKRAAPEGEEDELYAQAKAAASEKKRARAEAHRAPGLLPPLADPTSTNARPISYEIQKNRGLTPHRRKDLKNPRKKHRIKFAQAMVRRGGAVQDGSASRGAGRAAYGGEATGVKARVSKSRKL